MDVQGSIFIGIGNDLIIGSTRDKLVLNTWFIYIIFWRSR